MARSETDLNLGVAKAQRIPTLHTFDGKSGHVSAPTALVLDKGGETFLFLVTVASPLEFQSDFGKSCDHTRRRPHLVSRMTRHRCTGTAHEYRWIHWVMLFFSVSDQRRSTRKCYKASSVTLLHELSPWCLLNHQP